MRRCDAAGVGVRLVQDTAGFSGLVTCGSIWVCAVCSAKVMARRAVEIGAAVALGTAQGYAVAFGTMTMRHHRGQSLRECWDAVMTAWHQVTTGKGYRLLRARHGLAGWVRVIEVTWGENGWHVHVHLLLFGTFGSSDLEDIAETTFRPWERSLVRSGFDAPLRLAQDWQMVTGADLDGTRLGEYLAKGVHGSIGSELTQSQGKIARTRYSTAQVWEILDLWAQSGDLDSPYVGWWREWEQGSKGRRHTGWSVGLRDLLGLNAEQDDETIAAEELGTVDDTLVWITPDGWKRLERSPDKIPDVLTVTENSGAAGLSAWLAAHGIDHLRVQ